MFRNEFESEVAENTINLVGKTHLFKEGFSLELSAFFLTLLKDSIFAAGGKTVFIVEFINLQQAVKCGQRMRKIFGRCKNLPQKVSP